MEMSDALTVEVHDYKAAVRYMRSIFNLESRKYHLHLKKDHRDVRHRARYEDCLALPCVENRLDISKVDVLIEGYKVPGDPLGALPALSAATGKGGRS